MHTDKLRIGLLLDGLQVDAWIYRLIQTLQASDYAEVALVMLSAPQQQAEPGPPAGPLALPGRALGKLLTAIEGLIVGQRGVLPNAFRQTDASALLKGVDTLPEAAGSTAIAQRAVDVMLALGARTPRGELRLAARHGVWRVQYGDERMNRGVPAGYWEVMESRPHTATSLRLVGEQPESDRVLCRAVSSTRSMSILDNASNCCWKMVPFIARHLRELHAAGAEALFSRAPTEDAPLHFDDRPRGGAPGNRERALLIWRKVVERITGRWHEARYVDQWCVLYDFGGDLSTDLARFKPLRPPKDRFWADPFVIRRDGKHHLFVEEFVYREGKGRISVLTLEPDGRVAAPVTVLEEPHHLSYPFLFSFSGELYMLPESATARRLSLYRCVEFPHRWTFEKNLLEGVRVADATLHHRHGRWWMFANVAEYEESSNWEELHLYHADSPLSTRWTPHAANPVVSDVRSARPAGRLFERAGKLYRPSQNCARRYGYGFNLCEVTLLSETEYDETVVCAFEPKWRPDILSTHTLNYDDGLTVIDACIRRNRWELAAA